MKLLHVIPTVDPRGGGPMEAVLQGGLRLRELGHEVSVVTLDDPGSSWLSTYPLPVHALGPAKRKYAYSAGFVPWLRQHAGGYDLVVINGLWQYHSFGTWIALRRRRQPYVVFTHGMLDPWFKRTYPFKHLKKWLYWPWADYRVLRDSAAVLFTCEEERRLARHSFWLYRAKERVVDFGTRSPPDNGPALAARFLAAHEHLRGKRLLVFLGRLHEKKGCDLLIEAFADLASRAPDLHLLMIGPGEAGYRQGLERLAVDRSVADRVHFPGMLQGDEKWGALFAAEAFALPSHQENFGIAVAEALACGLPVLISDKVNIWREIQAAGAGLVDQDSTEGMRRLLAQWLALDADQRHAMGDAARALFQRQFSVDAMASSLIEVARTLPNRPIHPALEPTP